MRLTINGARAWRHCATRNRADFTIAIAMIFKFIAAVRSVQRIQKRLSFNGIVGHRVVARVFYLCHSMAFIITHLRSLHLPRCHWHLALPLSCAAKEEFPFDSVVSCC